MSVCPYAQRVTSDSDDASFEFVGRFTELDTELEQCGDVQRMGVPCIPPRIEISGAGKSPSPVLSRLSPRPSRPPERGRFGGRNTVMINLARQASCRPEASLDAKRLLTNLQKGFEELVLKAESVFYDAILQAPPTEVGRLQRECDEEKDSLRLENSAIQKYIQQSLDRLIRESTISDCHAVVVSKNDSGLKHSLRWVVSGSGRSTCCITRGELGRGGEAVVKEVIVCSAQVFRRMAIRHLFTEENQQPPDDLSTGAPLSRNGEQIQFVERLTRHGVPRLIPMRQWLYLGKDGAMKEGIAMQCYSSYYDVLMAAPEMAVSRRIRNAALLAETLYYFHKEGFVHRDVKLENVLIDEIQDPLLGDFGMVRRLGVPTGSQGTVGYRSPEILQAAGEKDLPADPRSDAWSFGVLLYISFLKTAPFEDVQVEHQEAVRSNDIVRRDKAFREFCGIVKRERERLLTGQYSPMIDPELGPIIASLLDLDPANRMPEEIVLRTLWQLAKRYEGSP